MKLVFATNNPHKLDEVRQILPQEVEVLSLQAIGFEAEIDETGKTLEENSMIKAKAVYQFINANATQNGGIPFDGVFADDTGLEIDALGGKPGVYTARWYLMNEEMSASEACSMSAAKPLNIEREIFAANRAKALRELAGKENRGAQFRTVITLIKDGMTTQVSGVVRGRIAEEEYGLGGFGYDPVFIPEGYDKTFGELPAEVKNNISHRARALAALVKTING